MDSRRSGLDYGPAIALAKDLGWSPWRATGMLQVIEMATMEEEAAHAK